MVIAPTPFPPKKKKKEDKGSYTLWRPTFYGNIWHMQKDIQNKYYLEEIAKESDVFL